MRTKITLLLMLIVLVALALRLHRLAEPLMRWDEGWSVGHASRSVVEVVRIASWEVHPPLFYLTLKPWLSLGRNLFLVRALPVLVGVAAAPASYSLARRLFGRPTVAAMAAGLAALSPGLTYYSQVLRMYPLVVLLLLLAAWALVRWLDSPRPWSLVLLWATGTCALYTLYYSAFALLGLFLYGLWVGHRRRVGLVLTGASTALAFAPWLAYAGQALIDRMAQASPAEVVMPVTPWGLAVSVWTALTFDFGSGGWGALAVLLLLLMAAALNWPSAYTLRRLLLPLLGLATTVAGVTLGSGFYFFAPRLLMPAVPFLVLVMAWALDALLRRSGAVGAIAGILLVVSFYPTFSGFVYEKSLEVSGEFNPHEYHDMIAARSAAEDIVFFNELALAGWYEMDRGSDDPTWSYALRWTPIIEPMASIIPRVARAAGERPRLWFVLYKGSFGPGRALKDWLDQNLFAESMIWGTESLFLSYLPPNVEMDRIMPAAQFGSQLRLEAAEYPSQPGTSGQIGVTLKWLALDSHLPDLRIVVQAWDETGAVLAQRDVRPANWERPTYNWQRGDVVDDRHGLLLTTKAETPIHLAVSVYDARTGQTVPVDGKTFLELATLSEQWR